MKLKRKFTMVLGNEDGKEGEIANLNDSVDEESENGTNEDAEDNQLKAKMSTLLTDNTTFLR